MTFDCPINSSNHRVNAGACEKAIRRTIAEMYGDDVNVCVIQRVDNNLEITVEKSLTRRTPRT